jgi:phosphatidylglycerol:prolipoprotein diacylglycerol transferase
VRSTLFHIPHADPIWGIPFFGLGWLIGLWILVSLVTIARLVRRHGWNKEVWSYLPVLAVVGVVIYAIVPLIEEQNISGELIGVPIRGYGLCLLLGVVGGVALAAYQAYRAGMSPEVIYSVSFWMFVCGIAGARTFYVIEYWDQFAQPSIKDTVAAILKLTDGGIVVYGSLFGGLLAIAVYSWRHKVPLLALADLLVPGMLLGLAVGRIGCLLNGCCWGGICDDSHLAITFPQASPPYVDHLESGTLLGLKLARADDDWSYRIEAVEPGSLADRQGLKVGDTISEMKFPSARELTAIRSGDPEAMKSLVTIGTRDGRRISWDFRQLPVRSRPVYPTQPLSALNAALLCCLVLAIYPMRRRDGVILALGLTIYPITRFLLEMIRTDEGGLFAVDYKVTISQAISVGFAALVVALWVYIFTRPRQTALAIWQADRSEPPSPAP